MDLGERKTINTINTVKMKYSVAAVLAVAATASAWSNATVSYVTEVVDVYTTVCPASSTLTFNGVTYTNTLTTVSFLQSQSQFPRIAARLRRVQTRTSTSHASTARSTSESKLTSFVELHHHRHQLPMYHQQASLHLFCCVLFHLVAPTVSKDSL